VTKPWGDSAHYDFGVENGGRFVRVQVKSTMFKDRGGYSCSVRGSCGPYKGDAFDFVAAYVIPEDLWYIIPAEKIRGQGSVAIYPKLEGSKYDCYKEAWHWLRGEHAGKLARVLAVAEGSIQQSAISVQPGAVGI
jgi:PD-(D/E)XK nuclease superfamily protein